MGSVVHKVLELLGLANKNAKLGIDSFEDDWFGKIFISDCQPNSLLQRAFDWQKSNSDYEWGGKHFLDCKNWLNTVLDSLYDPRSQNVIECEPFFDFEIPDSWAAYSYDVGSNKLSGQLRIKGSIDLIIKRSDSIYEIVDWKTGQRKNWTTGEEKTFEKLQDDPQLRMYHYAAHKLYPNIKQFIVTIYYIRDGGPFSFAFNEDDIKLTEKMLEKQFIEIKNTRIPRLNTSWKCRRLCGFGVNLYKGSDKTVCEYMRLKTLELGMDKVVEKYGNTSRIFEYGSGGGKQ